MPIRPWILALAIALPAAVWAQDPPGRVGRLAEVRGAAWLTPATGERASAFLTRPLTQGDRLATDVGARVEVQIGSAVLRVAERSDLTFTRLDDTHIEIMLASGSLALRVRQPELARELLVRTPDAALAPHGAGLVRVDRFGRGSYAWAVEGQWQVQGVQGGGWQMLAAGQRLELWRDAGGGERIEAAALPHGGDAFERWAQQGSDLTYASSDAGFTPEVSSEMTGVQDLNRYGSWRSSDYGAIWFPSQVSAGWSPYSQGQWAWVAPWGWTWVDAMPWGFAPFHYGRWVYVGNQWGWTPGAYTPRPTYAPALVGAASGLFNQSPRVPPTNWRPLTLGQTYQPAYPASSGYTRALNAPLLTGGALGSMVGTTPATTGITTPATPRPLPHPRRLMIGKPGLAEVAPPQSPQQPQQAAPTRPVATPGAFGAVGGALSTPAAAPVVRQPAPPAPLMAPPQPMPQARPAAPQLVAPPPGQAPERLAPAPRVPSHDRRDGDADGRDDRAHRGRIIR